MDTGAAAGMDVGSAIALAGLIVGVVGSLVGVAVYAGALGAKVKRNEEDTKRHDSYIGELREAKARHESSHDLSKYRKDDK